MSDKVKLNLGSGGRLLPGFINVDLKEYKFLRLASFPEATVLSADVFDLRTYFPAGTVDEVYSSHFFEHLTHVQVFDLVYLMWDLMKPDATLTVIVPNFYEIMEQYKVKHEVSLIADFEDLEVFHALIFGTDEEDHHRSIWSSILGRHYLTRDNFFKIQSEDSSSKEIKFIAKRI